jgi:hypothetical protein
LDTGSRLTSVPPKPGTAASSVVNRPTRRTHQRDRACTSIAAQAAVPGTSTAASASSTLSRNRRSSSGASAATKRERSPNGSASRRPCSTGRVARTNGRNTPMITLSGIGPFVVVKRYLRCS